jgi:actin-related protein
MTADFEKYKQFMYTTDNVERMMRETEEFISKTSDNKFFKREESKPKQEKQQKQKRNVHHKHPIFWLLYKMVSVEDFFTKQNDVEEMNFRIKFIETIKTDSGWMKANKIKISQVEGEAMDSADIPLLGAFFRAVCIRNNVSLMVIKGNIYKTILCDDADDVPKFIIQYNGEKFEFVAENEVTTLAKHARDNFFEFSKPLRAISAYKLDELREISRRVGVDSNGLLKKPLYEKILTSLTF